MARGGYVSHHIGKWHLGFHRDSYTPVARGFNTSYGFLEGGEDHWTHGCGAGGVNCHIPGTPQTKQNWDLWHQSDSSDFPGGPLYGTNGTRGDDKTYSAYLFTQQAVDKILAHGRSQAPSAPMFMYLALHNTHSPIEAPDRFVDMYDFGGDTLKETFFGMVSVVDETVANVTKALKEAEMWDNTLLVWTTDNGSPVQVAGSNAPLRVSVERCGRAS